MQVDFIKNEILNQPITITIFASLITMLGALVSYIWVNRKPRISIFTSCVLLNGERGLGLRVTNYSKQPIRIDTIGYAIDGSKNLNHCVSLVKNKTLEPQSCLEEFFREKDLDLRFMSEASKLFMKDQRGRIWIANKKGLSGIKNYSSFREEYLS